MSGYSRLSQRPSNRNQLTDILLRPDLEILDELRDQFNRQLEKLDAKESYFLDLAAEEGWPKDKLRDKINNIRDERKEITRQLEAATSQLETGRLVFLTALDLLDDPHGMYARKPDNETVKSIMNKALFTRLYVDGHRVTERTLNEPFNILNEAYTLYREQQADRKRRQGDGHAYHRTGGSVALTTHLAAVTDIREPSTWPGFAHTASSADLPEETALPAKTLSSAHLPWSLGTQVQVRG